MNLFVTHPNPSVCASWLDDQTVDRQLRVCAQVASNAVRLLDPGAQGYYQLRAVDAWTKWAMASKSNFHWLVSYACTMGNARAIYHRKHKSHIVVVRALYHENAFPEGELTPFPELDFEGCPNPYLAYRKYLLYRWLRYKPTWTGDARACPDWALDELRAKWGSDIPELTFHCYDRAGYTLKTQREQWAEGAGGRSEIYSCVE